MCLIDELMKSAISGHGFKLLLLSMQNTCSFNAGGAADLALLLKHCQFGINMKSIIGSDPIFSLNLFVRQPHIREAIMREKCSFLNIVQKAFDPPPFYLNICPILQGVFFNI